VSPIGAERHSQTIRLTYVYLLLIAEFLHTLLHGHGLVDAAAAYREFSGCCFEDLLAGSDCLGRGHVFDNFSINLSAFILKSGLAQLGWFFVWVRA
jgi:hypothetical protein